MTVSYGFFNSVNNDRTYGADDFGSMFEGVIHEGVFASVGGQFATTAVGTNMNVIVASGRAWLKNTWTKNDANIIFTIDPSDAIFGRIDIVVLEVNLTEAVRANSIKVVKGLPAVSPVPPTLTFTNGVYQYPMAEITINPGVSVLLSGDIVNKVGISPLVWVLGADGSIDIGPYLTAFGDDMTNLLTNDQAVFDAWMVERETQLANETTEFNDWFNNLQDQLSGNVEANLQAQITTLEGRATVSESDIVVLENTRHSHPNIRLSASSSQANPISSIGGALTSIYVHPFEGGSFPYIGVDGGTEIVHGRINSILTLALNPSYHLLDKAYDIFLYYDGSAFKLGTGPEWTNSTTRATTFSKLYGLYFNSAAMYVRNGSEYLQIGANRGLHLGSAYMTVAGTIGWSTFQRTLSNRYNTRQAYMTRSGTSNTYTGTTSRIWGAEPAADHRMVYFLTDIESNSPVDFSLGAQFARTSTGMPNVSLSGAGIVIQTTALATGFGEQFYRMFQEGNLGYSVHEVYQNGATAGATFTKYRASILLNL